MKKFFVGIFLLALFFSCLALIAKADQIEDLQKLKDAYLSEKNNKETSRQQLLTRLNNIKAGIFKAEAEIGQKEIEVKKGGQVLTYQKELLNERAKSYYKNVNKNSTLFLSVLVADDLSVSLRKIFYQKSLVDEDKRTIIKIVLYIKNLEQIKANLIKEKEQLAVLKMEVDKEEKQLAADISQLTQKIAELTAKQQSILAARSGSFTASVGDSELADDINASIKGFRENAPSGSFAVFSFGGYTHRNGMSQYGALGRVKSNAELKYEQILKHYYPDIQITKVDTNQTITVYGTNSYGQSFNDENYNIEEYMKHIYEVPSSWPSEVLRAQAIAARSYAYGKSKICSGQGCQEFKREENSDAWKQAVKDTEGLVMTGGPGNFQYSSTTGGWINGGVGWDTTDGGGGSNFIDKSYEKIAGSPWVYKAWYTETYRNNSDKCGRSNPWLSPEEMADVVNAAIALKTGGIDTSRITPVTTSCWGGNPYSIDELKNLVAGNGGISSASSVSVSQGNGTTNNVIINGIEMNGTDFKKAFNLRAPGRLSIPQYRFAFFNIEKR